MPRIPRTLPSLRAFAAPSPSSSSLLTPLARPTPATASSFSRALSTPSLFRPTALTALTSLSSSSRRPTLSPSSALASLFPLQQGVFQPTGEQVRTAVYGAEYQPSQIKRKRKHGFLGRLRTKNGRKTLKNRWNKGRKYLSH